MKKIFFIFLFFLGNSFSFPDLSTFDISKPIIRNSKITYVHQYQVDVGFGRMSSYLCLFRDTDYKDFINLDDGVGYKAIIDNAKCENPEKNLPWIVKASQTSDTSDLVIDMSMPDDPNGDGRFKLIVKENATEDNPFGELTMDYNYVLRPSNTPMYNATYESVKLPNNSIKFESSIFLDSVVIDNTFGATNRIYFYSSKILHEPGVGGHGTVSDFTFSDLAIYDGLINSYKASGYIEASNNDRNYPDGAPIGISTVNFAYNDNVVKYEIINGYGGQKSGVWIDEGPNGTGSFQSSDICLSRKDSWNHVPWGGYGIYNESGDRLPYDANGDNNPNTGIAVPYDLQAINGITTSNVTFADAVIIFSGSRIGMGMQCRKIADGSSYGNTFCPGTSLGDISTIVRINGEDYQNFPVFDIPEGTVLTDSGGNEYYIRQLGPKKVFSSKPLSDQECASLTIKSSETTPDHTFFNYPTINIPKSGAVLVNKLSSKPSFDTHSAGIKYSKLIDTDGDGILNYLDAYPIDVSKSKDDDYDGIEDSEDSDISIFQQVWEKYANKSLFSGYTK